MLTPIDIDAASTEARPTQPLPQDFGLTSARIRVFREPESLVELWENRWFWAGHAVVTLVGGVAAYEGAQSVAETALIVFFGFFAYLLVVAILVTAGIAAFTEIWRRFQPDHRQYVEYTRSLTDHQVRFFRWLRMQELWWQTLDGRRFELELAAVLRRLGYHVIWTGRAGDGGVDLVPSRAGRDVIVQCKAHKNPIGPGPIRDLYGTMIHRNAKEAWLVTATGFSQAAQDFANGKRIRLLRVSELLKAERPLDFWEETDKTTRS
jgi:hypothetical protein